jgi:isopenicillin-N N-acyltransferase like protein
MRCHRIVRATALAVALLCWLPVQASVAQDWATNVFKVDKGFDGNSFSYEVRSVESRSGYRLLRLSFPSAVITAHPGNNTVPAVLFMPDNLEPGAPRRPAVICLPILNGDEDLTSTVCTVLVQRGIPALMFTLPYYMERGSHGARQALKNNPEMFIEGVEQTISDIRRAADLLSSRPEIDPSHLGITGISLGGILSATAAGMEPRFSRVGLLLAGGDLKTIIHHADETRQLSLMLRQLPESKRAAVEAKLLAIDPLTWAPALRERAQQDRVLMINAAQDEVIPPDCTRKLAAALGMPERVVWFEGLGHYSAMAEFPRALRLLADFFARDLPPGFAPTVETARQSAKTPIQQLAAIVQQAVTMLSVEPQPRRCHFLEVEVTTTGSGDKPLNARARLMIGNDARFTLWAQAPGVGEVAAGQGEFPWLRAGTNQLVFAGDHPENRSNFLELLSPEHTVRYRTLMGAASALALVPDIATRWLEVKSEDRPGEQQNALRVTPREQSKTPGHLTIVYDNSTDSPAQVDFSLGGTKGKIVIHHWQTNAPAADELFEPGSKWSRKEVAAPDLHRMFAAVLNFGAEQFAGSDEDATRDASGLEIVDRDSAGQGLLCRLGEKTILFVQGTPAEMGTAQGQLLGSAARRMVERVLYGVGAADTVVSGEWFPDRLAGIERRVTPHLPDRFFEESDALADAAGIPRRDLRFANLFPERFHCTGVALRGKATVGGQVLHARVLDYMRDIGLQHNAVVTVFIPKGRHPWLSLGYAGFIGTVTGMNAHGLAIGEMGGRGEGLWDGMPMSFLLRDVMERARTVEEAVAIIRETPRTCEYYYVLSDKTGTMRALHCTPEKVLELKPGEQHPDLPRVPEDVVFVSGLDRATVLAERIQQDYGSINAARLIEIIKRPVAMRSNLHNAIFAPQTLEMWFADAGRKTPACDEPYTRVKLDELLRFYQENASTGKTANPAR